MKRTWDFNPNGGGRRSSGQALVLRRIPQQPDRELRRRRVLREGSAGVDASADKTRQAATTRRSTATTRARLTWQATPRNKINFSYEKDRRITPAPARGVHRLTGSDHLHAVLSERDHHGHVEGAGQQQAPARYRIHALHPGLGRAPADQSVRRFSARFR